MLLHLGWASFLICTDYSTDSARELNRPRTIAHIDSVNCVYIETHLFKIIYGNGNTHFERTISLKFGTPEPVNNWNTMNYIHKHTHKIDSFYSFMVIWPPLFQIRCYAMKFGKLKRIEQFIWPILILCSGIEHINFEWSSTSRTG